MDNLREVITEAGEVIQTLPQLMKPNPDNPIHQLFLILGCDLDYVPIHKYEAFMQCLQFLAALWFLYWFTKFTYSLLRHGLRGGL